MRLSDLPDQWRIAVDTESSGTRVDDGARVSIVSYAYRNPGDSTISARAIPFDQGWRGLPLGSKLLPARHEKRIGRWPKELQEEVAPNLEPHRYDDLLQQLTRLDIVYHNRKFDEPMLAAGLRSHPRPHFDPPVDRWLEMAFAWDTMVAQHGIDPRFPIGLKPTATRLELTEGGEDEAQKAIKPFLGPASGSNADPRYDLVPWSVIEPYATEDAVLTLLLDEWQDEHLTEENVYKLYWIHGDMNVTQTLMHMEQRGLGWDVAEAKRQTKLLKAEKKRLATALPFSGGTGAPTTDAARKFFFTDAGRPPYPKKETATGKPQVDTEVQERLIADGVEWAAEYHQHEKVKSALSKWYEGWTQKAGDDQRLRCDFDQVGVVTGRLGGRHINLVAIPKDHQMPEVPGLRPVRSLIRPKDSHRLWHIDMGQAEVRVGCALAECESLLEGFVNDIDAYSQTAFKIFGTDQPPYRQYTKTLFLAIQYGAGLKRIQAQLEKDTGERWPMTRVKEFKMDWHTTLPEMTRAIDLAKHEAEVLGYVKLWNGRFSWFEHYRGGPPDPPFTAFNRKCQGGVAEVMKVAMSEWDMQYPGTLVDQIHDALVIEIPEDDTETPNKCATMMVQHFESAMTRRWQVYDQPIITPFEAEVKEWK